jgi:hypothetical protein
MLDKIKRKLNIPGRAPGVFSGEKGQSLVEMALITPLLLLLFIGVLEVGWAIRGYIVLLNADREGTRFAARGPYLDFSQNDRADIGYDYVLEHTLDSLSNQLDFDVVSDDPNGTLIVTHYLVDTRKPCEEPPCNDDCKADNRNKNGGCDCSTPDRREPDYLLDDRLRHPGVSGFEHYTALYGIPRESRLDHNAIVAQLKEQNDAFNCSLNVKDPSAPWSPNSLVVVEAWYDQPQLLGVPLVSNYFTDPVPLYVQTAMRITADRGPGTSDVDGGGCPLLPIIVHTKTLEAKGIGGYLENIRQGSGEGNFGWLRWTDDSDYLGYNPNSEEYLASELREPNLAEIDYREPVHKDADDTAINAGDWVWGLTGNVSSNGVARTELQRMVDEYENNKGILYRIPVWDRAEGTGGGTVYHIVGFILVELTGYDLGGNPKEISARFWGWANDGCPGNGH